MFFNVLFSLRKQLYSLILLLFSISSVGQVFFNDMESMPESGNWIGMRSIDSGHAFSGEHFSHTDSLLPYGIGIEQNFDENLVRKNIVLEISGYVMTNDVNNRALYVVTVVDENNETTLWKGIPIGIENNYANNWSYFSDSIIIPASLTTNSKIKAYLWNQDKKYSTNIDDLKFEFKVLSNPTFIPLISIDEISDTGNEVLFNNRFYSINYNTEQNETSIVGSDGKIIFSNILYYDEKQIRNNLITNQRKWKFTGQKRNGSSIELSFKIKDESKKTLVIVCDPNNGKIEFDIVTRYRKKQNIYRESIVLNFDKNVTEVYRNNRKVDNIFFQDEYWLDNEGVKIGDGLGSAIIYHVPEISSLQLDVNNKLLFVNLDYEKDHPFFRFPLNPDSSDWKKEESYNTFERGDSQSSSFTITIGNPAPTLPRFMKNPNGFEATYIWTEHADYSDIRTNRATYFGSEHITDADSSTGGFVYYNIPVTKSVFYDNPDSISNYLASNGVFNTLESTILTDEEFSDYLFQIYDHGNEICLHTPEQYTTTKDRLEEALLYMQINFKSPTWIDHGNNNGPQNNREDLICDATLKNSPFYSIDIWKKYGIKYLHNAYYEELSTYKDWQFEGSLEKPYSGFGDFFPKPDYYQLLSRTENLYHWTTTSALFVKEPWLWDYLFNTKKIKSLVDNWYIEINHVYPAWVDPKKGMWTWDSDSTIIAQPGFNKSLETLAHFRDLGRLNITTVAEFLNYRIALDNIDYSILPDGRVKITNNNDFEISGLSMVAKARSITVDDLVPNTKLVGNDIIFWFNLDSGQTTLIRLIK